MGMGCVVIVIYEVRDARIKGSYLDGGATRN